MGSCLVTLAASPRAGTHATVRARCRRGWRRGGWTRCVRSAAGALSPWGCHTDLAVTIQLLPTRGRGEGANDSRPVENRPSSDRTQVDYFILPMILSTPNLFLVFGVTYGRLDLILWSQIRFKRSSKLNSTSKRSPSSNKIIKRRVGRYQSKTNKIYIRLLRDQVCDDLVGR